MQDEDRYGVYGYRFAEGAGRLCSLYAVGYDMATAGYLWDGLERTDGPLYLFQYTLTGEGVFEQDGEVYRIAPGQAFMAEIPGQHRYYHPGGGEPWRFLFILLRQEPLQSQWSELVSKLGRLPQLPVDSAPIQTLRGLVREASAGRIADAYRASSQVYHLMMELLRFASGRAERAEWPVKIHRAAALIEERYSNLPGLEELADIVGLSKYHLIRSFAKVTGLTPSEYAERIRMRHAAELLVHTDWSMERIASELGYGSGSYLIRVFRKHTGIPPGAFRSNYEYRSFIRLHWD